MTSNNKLSGTKTEQNLINSFAGESQARNRYHFFAKVAKKEGYEQIAQRANRMLKKRGLTILPKSFAMFVKLKNTMKRGIKNYWKMSKTEPYLKKM